MSIGLMASFAFEMFPGAYTVLVLKMAHRIWKKTKQEPGTAGPGNMLGCCLVSFRFLSAILSTSTVVTANVCSVINFFIMSPF